MYTDKIVTFLIPDSIQQLHLYIDSSKMTRYFTLTESVQMKSGDKLIEYNINSDPRVK